MEQQYHEKAIHSKSDSVFFIPKKEVRWFFSKGKFTEIDSAKVNDTVVFFDTNGNVAYQALVVQSGDETIRIRALNLKTAQYYETPLSIDSIYDLHNGYPYKIKIFRFDQF